MPRGGGEAGGAAEAEVDRLKSLIEDLGVFCTFLVSCMPRRMQSFWAAITCLLLFRISYIKKKLLTRVDVCNIFFVLWSLKTFSWLYLSCSLPTAIVDRDLAKDVAIVVVEVLRGTTRD